MPSNETVLDLVGLGIAPGSGRAMTHSLDPIAVGTLRRLANGRLSFRPRPGLRKYRMSVYFSDVWPPAFGGLWKGHPVTVHSAAELQQPAAIPLERKPVPGSIVWRDAAGYTLPSGEDETVAPEGAVWVVYRPILECLVESWDLERDEYEELVSATLNLLEDQEDDEDEN